MRGFINNENEVSDFLKSNNWRNSADKNVFQPLQNNLSLKKTLNNDFFSTLKPSGNEKSTDIPGYSNKMDNWNNTVEKILSSYNEDINKLSKDAKSQNWLNMALLCFLSFIIGIFLCYFFIRSRIYKIMGEELDKYKDSVRVSGLFAFISIVELLRQRKNEYKNKLEAIEKTDKKPEDESISVISKGKDIETKDSIIEETNNTVELNITNDSNTQTGLFFTIPDGEGKFEVSDGKSQNDGNCFYRIENKPNSNHAILSYISNEKDKRAIENIENYLLPVCDIENFSDRRNASKVHMKGSGIVKLNNGIWVIDTNHKVKIKLV